MPASFSSIAVCNVAALVRTALVTSTVWKPMQDALACALSDDNMMMSDYMSKECGFFDTPSIVSTWTAAVKHGFLPADRIPMWSSMLSGIDLSDGVQRRIAQRYNIMAYSFVVTDFLSRRMARWRPIVSQDARAWWDFCGPFLVHYCNSELVGAPSCVVAALLKTCLNGWCTARRFGQPHSRCLFGCDNAEDSLEHYLQCVIIENVWEKLFRTSWGEVECRLAIGCSDPIHRNQRGYFLYGLFNLYNFMRHSPGQRDTHYFTNFIKSRIIFAAGLSISRKRRVTFSFFKV
jgi:hypothetical protein